MAPPPSHGKNLECRVEAAPVVGIGRDHPLVRTTCAHDHVRIDDVGGATGGEQPADVGGVDAV
jgi:hypothetical protein